MKFNRYLSLLLVQILICDGLPIVTNQGNSLTIFKRIVIPEEELGVAAGTASKEDSAAFKDTGTSGESSDGSIARNPGTSGESSDGSIARNPGTSGESSDGIIARNPGTSGESSDGGIRKKSDSNAETTTDENGAKPKAGSAESEYFSFPSIEHLTEAEQLPAYRTSMEESAEGSITQSTIAKQQIDNNKPVGLQQKEGGKNKWILNLATGAAVNVGVMYLFEKFMSSDSSTEEPKTSTTRASTDSTSSCVPTTEQLCPSQYNNGTYVDNAGNLYNSEGDLISAIACVPTNTTLCPFSPNNGTYFDASGTLYDSNGDPVNSDSETASGSSTCIPSESNLCPISGTNSTLYSDGFFNIYDISGNPLLSSVTSLNPTNSSCSFEEGLACYIGNGTFLDGYGSFFDNSRLKFSGNNASSVAEEYGLHYTPALSK